MEKHSAVGRAPTHTLSGGSEQGDSLTKRPWALGTHCMSTENQKSNTPRLACMFALVRLDVCIRDTTQSHRPPQKSLPICGWQGLQNSSGSEPSFPGLGSFPWGCYHTNTTIWEQSILPFEGPGLKVNASDLSDLGMLLQELTDTYIYVYIYMREGGVRCSKGGGPRA